MNLVQIESKKLDWNVASKVGSLDNAQHKPGGGEKKVSKPNICVTYNLGQHSERSRGRHAVGNDTQLCLKWIWQRRFLV